MFGKGALIFVAGFGILFSIYQMNLSKVALRASDNFNFHYMKALVHEASTSSMNLAINQVWADNEDSTTYTIFMDPCTTDVLIYPSGSDTIIVKVVSRSRAYDEVYFAEHGVSIQIIDSTLAYFTQSSSIAEYFWFTGTDIGVTWNTGDTVRGPIHNNQVLRTNGSPVFYGKVTARLGISPNPAKKGGGPKAKFYGGWEIGLDIELPTDMSALESAIINANGGLPGDGGSPYNDKCLYDSELELKFLNDGTVIRTVNGTTDTVAVSDIAPTGVLGCSEDIHVSGVLNGEVTIYSEGDIWIDDDITYADNPIGNPNSDDLLGLIASENVWITDNPANSNDINIHGSVFAGESFKAQNHNGRGISGTLNLIGSIAQATPGPVGQSGFGGGMAHGFSKNYYYDPRLQTKSPPYFPGLGELKLVSWWE